MNLESNPPSSPAILFLYIHSCKRVVFFFFFGKQATGMGLAWIRGGWGSMRFELRGAISWEKSTYLLSLKWSGKFFFFVVNQTD